MSIRFPDFIFGHDHRASSISAKTQFAGRRNPRRRSHG